MKKRETKADMLIRLNGMCRSFSAQVSDADFQEWFDKWDSQVADRAASDLRKNELGRLMADFRKWALSAHNVEIGIGVGR